MSDHPDLNRRQWLQRTGATALGLAASVAVPAWGQGGFPSKPLRIIVPLPAGSAVDSAVRIYAEQMQRIMKQPVVVENKPGGAYVIAMQALASAPADGYTLMHINVSMCSTQASLRKFDMLKQMVPITKAGEDTPMLVASTKAPFKSVKEMVAYGKANSGKLTYAVAGQGSAEHLMSVMLEKAAGFSATVVPYKGAPEGIIALMQGEVDYQIVPTSLAIQFLPRGNVRPLAVLTPHRLPQFPDLPTIAEAGVILMPATYWGGFAAPAGTPAPVIEYLRLHIAQAVRAPEIRDRLQTLGLTPVVSASSAEFTAYIRDELERMEMAVKSANLKIA